MKEDFKTLASKLDALRDSMDILIKLTALNIGKDSYFRNKDRKDERIEALDDLDLPDDILALIVGSTPESVRSLRSHMKGRRRSGGEKPDVEFHPQDLHRVLSNPVMFPSTIELLDFAKNILGPNSIVSSEQIDQLVENIIAVFQDSDRMKQALFIQALEHRATAKELRDTQFLRFLEAWEKHIGR